MKKIIYLDIKKSKDKLYSIAGIIDVNNVRVDDFFLTTRTDSEGVLFLKFLEVIGKFCSKYDWKDKYYVGAYNAPWQLEETKQLFDRQKNSYAGSFFNWKYLDPLTIAYHLEYKGKLVLEEKSLYSVARALNMESPIGQMKNVVLTRNILRKFMK